MRGSGAVDFLRSTLAGDRLAVSRSTYLFFAPPPRGGLVLVAIQGKGAI